MRSAFKTSQLRNKSGVSVFAFGCYQIDHRRHHGILINTHFTNINPQKKTEQLSLKRSKITKQLKLPLVLKTKKKSPKYHSY